MSKRKQSHKTNGNERLLIELDKLTKKPGPSRELATSLRNWYMSNQEWSSKQILLVRSLIYKSKSKSKKKLAKYSLYAIGDGDNVKIGVSTNIGKRLNSIQVGHPKKLKVLWKHYIGRERGPAFTAEKKLHRFCKKYRLRGEWFKMDAMVIVEQFSLKEKIEIKIEQEEYDLSSIARFNENKDDWRVKMQ